MRKQRRGLLGGGLPQQLLSLLLLPLLLRARGARGHAEYLVSYACTNVDKLQVPVQIMGAPSVHAPPDLASQFFVVRLQNAQHPGDDGFGHGTQPVTDGSPYVAGETLHVTFLGGAGGEFVFEVDGTQFVGVEMDGQRPKCGGRRIAGHAVADVVMPGDHDGRCVAGGQLPDVTFRGAFASAHGAVQILPEITLHGTCTGEAAPSPPPPPGPAGTSSCGTSAAPHSIPTQGSDCQCISGWWSPSGHGNDCTAVRVCDADQYQSVQPTPTSNAQCLPLTECRSDEVEVEPPTETSNRRCENVWQEVSAEEMGDPTCWNVESGFVFSRCCNTAQNPQGDPTCWAGDFTYARCCRTTTATGAGSAIAPPPTPPPPAPPPLTPLPPTPPSTVVPPPPPTARPPPPPARPPPPPPPSHSRPPPPPPSRPPPPPSPTPNLGAGTNGINAYGAYSTVNCVGAWSPCASDCRKHFHVTTIQSHGGTPCEVADMTYAACHPGQGQCPSKNSGAGASESSLSAFDWVLIICAAALLAGLGYLCFATDGNLRGVLLTVDDSSDHLQWHLRGKDGTKAQVTRGKRKAGGGGLLAEDALALAENDQADNSGSSTGHTATRVPPLQLDGTEAIEGSSLYDSPPRSWKEETNPVGARQTQVSGTGDSSADLP